MTVGDTDIERRWDLFRRWGPYGLLGMATVLSTATAELMPGTAERNAAAALVLAALALQLWWGRAGRTRPGPAPAGAAYYTVRWAIGFALTWLNPFYAFYAVTGYFDADKLLPGGKHWWRIGPFACSVAVAGGHGEAGVRIPGEQAGELLVLGGGARP